MAKMIKANGHQLVLYGVPGSDAPCDEFVPIVSEKHLANAFQDGKVDPLKMKWENIQNSPEWQEFCARGKDALTARYTEGDIALISYGYFQHFVKEVVPLHCEFICGYSGIFTWDKVFPSYAWRNYLYGEMKKASNPDWCDAVIPHYVDVARFPFVETKQPYLLFLGRLNVIKGPDIAIDIARAAGLPLIIAGTAEDGNPKPQWLADKVGNHLVRFVGKVSFADRNALLANATALLSPIRWIEAFGMVNIEALACGTPIIASDFGALPEIIIPGKTGFICRNMGEFVSAVQAARRLSPKDCRRDAEDRFSLESAWPKYEAVFRELLRRLGNGWYETLPGCWRGHAVVERLKMLYGDRPIHGAEIGTGVGKMSAALLRQLPNLESILLVDPYREAAPEAEYRKSGDTCALRTQAACDADMAEADRRTAFAEKRRTFIRKSSLAASKDVADESLDFIFLDGDHTAGAVAADVRAWWPKLKPGGMLSGHDWENAAVPMNGVANAVSIFASAEDVSIYRAADSVWGIQKPIGPQGPGSIGDIGHPGPDGPVGPVGSQNESGVTALECTAPPGD
jgi:glycosyltransferase involved in cell wall biosynthesis